MSTDKKSICIGALTYIHSLLEKDYEVCGNLFMNSDYSEKCLIPSDMLKGTTILESERGSCVYKAYSPYIFHTHPNITLPYPSFEDYVKVMKHSEIKHSIIFTSIGVWNISCGDPIGKEEGATFFHKNKLSYKNSRIENDLYYSVRRKHQEPTLNVHLETYIKNVTTYFKKVNMTIRFDKIDLEHPYYI